MSCTYLTTPMVPAKCCRLHHKSVIAVFTWALILLLAGCYVVPSTETGISNATNVPPLDTHELMPTTQPERSELAANHTANATATSNVHQGPIFFDTLADLYEPQILTEIAEKTEAMINILVAQGLNLSEAKLRRIYYEPSGTIYLELIGGQITVTGVGEVEADAMVFMPGAYLMLSPIAGNEARMVWFSADQMNKSRIAAGVTEVPPNKVVFTLQPNGLPVAVVDGQVIARGVSIDRLDSIVWLPEEVLNEVPNAMSISMDTEGVWLAWSQPEATGEIIARRLESGVWSPEIAVGAYRLEKGVVEEWNGNEWVVAAVEPYMLTKDAGFAIRVFDSNLLAWSEIAVQPSHPGLVAINELMVEGLYIEQGIDQIWLEKLWDAVAMGGGSEQWLDQIAASVIPNPSSVGTSIVSAGLVPVSEIGPALIPYGRFYFDKMLPLINYVRLPEVRMALVAEGLRTDTVYLYTYTHEDFNTSQDKMAFYQYLKQSATTFYFDGAEAGSVEINIGVSPDRRLLIGVGSSVDYKRRCRSCREANISTADNDVQKNAERVNQALASYVVLIANHATVVANGGDLCLRPYEDGCSHIAEDFSHYVPYRGLDPMMAVPGGWGVDSSAEWMQVVKAES